MLKSVSKKVGCGKGLLEKRSVAEKVLGRKVQLWKRSVSEIDSCGKGFAEIEVAGTLLQK